MTDLVKQAPQYAQQSLRIVDGGSKDQIIRRAYCQHHQQWSRNYQGQSAFADGRDGWLFKCANSSLHMSHFFVVRPPVGVPTKDMEQIEAWMKAQRLAAVAKANGSDRGQ